MNIDQLVTDTFCNLLNQPVIYFGNQLNIKVQLLLCHSLVLLGNAIQLFTPFVTQP